MALDGYGTAHEPARREHRSVVIGARAYSRAMKQFFFVIAEFGIQKGETRCDCCIKNSLQHLKWEVTASSPLQATS
eukprot:CAMPEP_0201942602 /NCGR_PEP_ID=MMETSP0903-20130614/49341_1 /ASSEMBLY_ACC=CAM_ASM_000552 /TAXON_ID=420261 /ORGANISM="Thalassiosira antarctica, Strain CCMP982" /LENGTH=75 /DNA_ID=CAMNT_0048485037 /DNA_START=204 /DNA_END=431 /DNA_ORIENTATION=+